MIRPTLAAGMLALLAVECASAQEIKVQEQWAYTTRIDGTTGRTQFLATTVALEDENAWLVLGCGDDGRITISIMYTGGFRYPLQNSVGVSFQVDSAPRGNAVAVSVGQGQISIDPRIGSELLSFLVDGRRLSISIFDSDSKAHSYAWPLQPSDVALSDIRAHCLEADCQ